MDRNRVSALAWKDFRELIHNKRYVRNLVLMSSLSGLFFPMILYLGMHGYLPFTSVTAVGAQNLPPGTIPPEFEGDAARMTAYFVLQYISPPVLLIFTTQLSTLATVDVFVGEKERKTLERLLALAITDSEIIVGKMISPFLLSMFSGGIMTGSLLFFSLLLTGICPAEHWAAFSLTLMPCSVLFSVSATLAVTLRGQQYREALQYAAIVSVSPLIILFLLQSFAYIILDTKTVLLISLVLTLVSVCIIPLIVRIFDRETILVEG